MMLAGACFSKRARIASHIVLSSRSIIGRVYANTLKGLDLKSFAVIESTRQVKGLQTTEYRCYISSLPADAQRLAQAIRAHWSVENQLHWCMDVAFADDQMRARTQYAAHNLAVLKQLVLNLSRLDPTGPHRQEGWYQDPRPGCIHLRYLSRCTSRTWVAFMRLPCQWVCLSQRPGARQR
ncbi:ISAs1 family transposase [Azotobacter chroococcum subsp. isscasi]|nr:ISAs1 family transposase [Azotobacter chroococcum subsp. isscasi]